MYLDPSDNLLVSSLPLVQPFHQVSWESGFANKPPRLCWPPSFHQLAQIVLYRPEGRPRGNFWPCSPPPSGNEGNIFQIDEETGNITMAKAADVIGPVTLTILVGTGLTGCQWWGKWTWLCSDSFLASGVAGDQQGPVCCDAGRLRRDEEEQERSSFWEGALRGIRLQQLGPRERDPPGPDHQPALQGPGPGRGLC